MRRLEFVQTSDGRVGIKVAEGSPIVEAAPLDGQAAAVLGWKGKTKSLSVRFFDLLTLLAMARKHQKLLGRILQIPNPEDLQGYLELEQIRRLKSFQGTRDILTMKRDITNHFEVNESGSGVALQYAAVRGRPEKERLRLAFGAEELHFGPGVAALLSKRLEAGLQDVLERPMQSASSQPPPAAEPSASPRAEELLRVDISRLPHTERFLFGRDKELEVLDEAWALDHVHVVSIVAWGGVGKSALVNGWLSRLASKGYGGAAAVFGWSFYNQGTEGGGTADLFMAEALKFFGAAAPITGDRLSRSKHLRTLLNRQRTLLILDGIEPLQSALGPREGFIEDNALSHLLQDLAATMNGLCILTTRPPFKELDRFGAQSTVREIKLDHLSDEDGAALLRSRGVEGSEAALRSAAQAVSGHSLTLLLVGNFVAEVLGGDISRHFEASLSNQDERAGEHARRIIDAYDRWFGKSTERALLRILGLFDRPASADCIAALRSKPVIPGITEEFAGIPNQAFHRAVARMQRAGLLFVLPGGKLDTHPLIREQAKELIFRECRDGFQQAHKYLYEHLQEQAEEFPTTVEKMQPLYQAIRHGCLAGLHNDVIEQVIRRRLRIRSGQEYYSTFDMGALGEDLVALSWFFEDGWSRTVPGLLPQHRFWVIREAVWIFDIFGRRAEFDSLVAQAKNTERQDTALTALVDEGRTVLALAVKDGAMGRFDEARRGCARVMEIAEQTSSSLLRLTSPALSAYLYYLEGRPEEAYVFCRATDKAFVQAGILVDRRPVVPEGIEFYWEHRVLLTLHHLLSCLVLEQAGDRQLLNERVRSILAILEQESSPICVAIAHTALGVALGTLGRNDEAHRYFDQAVESLQSLLAPWLLVWALLARGFFLLANDLPEQATRELDEALECARRLSLCIFECDALLLRSDLALRAGAPGPAREALAAAAAIIEERGYGLRRPYLDRLRAELPL